MKKFTFKGVLDGLSGFRSSGSQQTKMESEVEETLRAEYFQAAKTVRHGFPYDPKAVTFDPIQKILAIGTKSGSLRLFCQPGVECHVQHPCQAAVIQLMFLVNEGALVSVCADDSLHLWNLRQKMPEIAHSLKFQRERITYCHLPFQSKWLYIGTERGNIHVANVESFALSGYVINWNKAIELSRKTHPGAVVHLSDNPIDPNKMLIGFESGTVVLWDLRNKTAEYRFQYNETLRSISWHHEGKQFMCSHANGSLSTWNIRNTQKPVTVVYPHGKTNKEGRAEYCKPIDKVEWKMSRTGDPFIIFSGGLTGEMHEKTPSVTIIYGKTTTVLEMEHDVINFITLCESPWESDLQDPYAVVVLLHNDLVLIDLTTPGYPCFENPYPMDLHESPVTYCTYLVDCPPDLIPAFYSVGSKASKRSGFSEKAWPVSGGEWGTNTCSYPEIIITGHADGSLKFWDSSAVSLQVLYKLKTAKVFEKPKSKSFDGQEDDPFAIQQVAFCPESRVLCVAAASSQVLLFRFSKTESVSEVPSLEIPIIYELNDDPDYSPDYEYAPRSIPTSETRRSERGSCSSEEGRHPSFEYFVPLKMKSGPIKRAPGFQAELACLTPWVDGEPPGQITALSVNSSYGIMAYGNENGLVVIDIVQRTCLLNLGTPDLYGTLDPYQRIPRSPKKNPSDNNISDSERNRSPTASDQTYCSLPISLSQSTSFSANDSERCHISCHSSVGNVQEQSCARKCARLSNSNENYKNPDQQNLNAVDKNGNSINTNLASETIAQTIIDIPPIPPPRRKRKRNTKVFTDHQSDEVDGGCISRSETKEESNKESRKFSARKTSSNKEDKLNVEELCGKNDQKSNLVKQFRRSVSMKDKVKKEWKRTKFGSTEKDILVDLRGDNMVIVDSCRKLKGQMAKPDKIDSSFSRSRSSSMSSLENISSEAIQHLTFVDSFCRKPDTSTSPSLWVGTNLGSVIVITLNLPSPGEQRLTQPIMVSPSGTIFRLKGPVLNISFLNCTGAVIPDLCNSWKDLSRDQSQGKDSRDDKKPTLVNSGSLNTPTNHTKGRASPTTSLGEVSDQQFVVLTSEKQARVLALPSQSCIYKVTITETSFVVRADVTPFRDSACLFCYVANGNITAFSLPSLKMLLNQDFLPLTDLRIARTICFSNYSQGLYLCTPSEIQKFTVSADQVYNLQEMLGQLFLSKDMPEAPKQGFFKGLFGGGPSLLDREELFGESSGKPSRSVAKHIPRVGNIDHIRAQSSSLAGEVSRTRMALQERGEALGLLEERTTRMMTEAENFSHTSHQLMLKYKDKKWYQL